MKQEISKDQDCTFFFQLVIPPHSEEKALISDPKALKCHFSVEYRPIYEELETEEQEADDYRVFKFHHEIKNYRTLYILSSWVSPAQGGEICRAGTICTLTLELDQVSNDEAANAGATVMYEVGTKTQFLYLYSVGIIIDCLFVWEKVCLCLTK